MTEIPAPKQKTTLMTGSTDGIWLETARNLVSLGQHVLLHGRNPSRLEEVESILSVYPVTGTWRSTSLICRA